MLLTAVSPIPVLYATFGRPHTLLFAWLMWSTVLALRAARHAAIAGCGSRRAPRSGSSVFVHPTAPLYAITAFGAVFVYARPARGARRGPAPSRCVVTFVPYYVKTLHVLSDRYGVGSSGKAGAHVLRPAGVGGRAALPRAGRARPQLLHGARARRRRRARAAAPRGGCSRFCALTVAAPVVFFSVVPTSGDSALFFDRYMIPATPAFLVLVAAGVPRDRALGGAAAAPRRSRSSSPGSSASSCATTSITTGRRAASDSTRIVARGRARAGGHGAVRLDGHERRVLLRVRLRPSREPPRPPASRCATARSSSRRRLLRARRAVPRDGSGAALRALGLLRGVTRRGRGRRAQAAARATADRAVTTSPCARRGAPLRAAARTSSAMRLRLAWRRACR